MTNKQQMAKPRENNRADNLASQYRAIGPAAILAADPELPGEFLLRDDFNIYVAMLTADEDIPFHYEVFHYRNPPLLHRRRPSTRQCGAPCRGIPESE